MELCFILVFYVETIVEGAVDRIMTRFQSYSPNENLVTVKKLDYRSL